MIRNMRSHRNWGLPLAVLACMLCATPAAQRLWAAEVNPVRHQPDPAAIPQPARIILKLRAAAATAATSDSPAARVARVGSRTALGLNLLRSITPRMQVLEVA